MEGSMEKLTTPLWKRKLLVLAQAAAFVIGIIVVIVLFCIGIYYGTLFTYNYPEIGLPILGGLTLGFIIGYVYKAMWRSEEQKRIIRERQEKAKAESE